MPKSIAGLLFLFFLVINGCGPGHQLPLSNYVAQKSSIAQSAMVVSPHALSTQVGLEVLRDGGNAIDAAIAVQWAMAVVYPRAGNIGGGGLMVIRLADGTIASLDYREKAPKAASRDMYLDDKGQVIEGLSVSGHLAAGVPGTVAGMFEAHKKYGKLPMNRLLAPAIQLAKGFSISEGEASRLNGFQADFRKYNEAPNPFFKDEWKTGDKLRQPELGKTLKRIQQEGPSGFYKGETADYIVAEMRSGNGIITLADLEQYTAKWREPIVGKYHEYRIISMPPPSSGGVALIQMLKMLEPYDLSDMNFQSQQATHLIVETMRRAYADRAKHLGDIDFYDVPVEGLLDEDYLKGRMADFSPEKASPSNQVMAGGFKVMESFETEHTSIVDAEGNAVSVTTTLNSNYGSKVWVSGAGFFLNNEMDDFSVKPGVPNQFGLIGAEANAIAPGKRMLSSMTPTIIEKDGKLFMVLGSPGGSTIITSVLEVFLNVVEFGMPVDKAVSSPRFHHQWVPDQIMLEENALSPEARDALIAKGHKLQPVKYLGVVKAIVRLPDGKLQGAGDPRNSDDAAAGY